MDIEGEVLERCLAYAEGLFAVDTETRGWILEQLEARGLPRIEVSPLEGRLLAFLAAAVGARRLLEVGTLGGYSALWLVSLLPEEARLLTLERDPEHARLARQAFERAGETNRIQLVEADARRRLTAMAADTPRSFDLVFLDADKRAYPTYLEASRSLLRRGGLLLADNAFWDGRVLDPDDDDPDTAGIREFNRLLARDPAFEATIVPVRDGLAVARFLG